MTKELYKEIINKFGIKDQLIVFAEEVGELLQAVSKYNRNPCEKNRKQVIAEIADVSIMLGQVKVAFNIKDCETFNTKYFKLMKLQEIITND